MFLGQFQHTVDSKGRISIPVKFREILTDRYEEKLIVTTDFDQCLMAFPIEEWGLIEEKAKKLPMMQREVKDWLRSLYSSAEECSLDRQGRILVPSTLRERARLNREIVLLGVRNKIEIWDLKRWKEKESQLSKNSEKISEALAGLGF
ncbi:MAG TPA: division/cell wall cluster transcriptional repressor MraZ [Nitrospiria bacterium]|nr:division/cell wall cluster transcriptional repressor MraZ [Nitrospiria bacterium]